MNSTEKELFIKEIAYRASRRGTKELDTRLKPFTNKETLENFSPETLTLLRNFLLETEMTLMSYLVDHSPLPDKYKPLKSYLND